VLFSSFVIIVGQCSGHVIRSEAVELSPKFSPYYAAFNEKLKRDIREYDRLKQQLKQINPIDWDEIAKVKAFESTDSD
jgi:hypothetical protein